MFFFIHLEPASASSEMQEQKSNQNQRYDEKELYKPKFDFRSRRRTQMTTNAVEEEECSTKETN